MTRAMNVFCLAGMILALVPITVSWATADDTTPVGEHISAIDIMAGDVTADCPCLLMSATIFTLATVSLLVSPLGSLFQIVGVAVFFVGAPFTVNCGGAYCIWTATASTGIATAVVAAVLPLIGMVAPFGVTKDLKLRRLKERFITFGLMAEVPRKPPAEKS